MVRIVVSLLLQYFFSTVTYILKLMFLTIASGTALYILTL